MTASETISAFESHLITEAEAVEQTLCDRLDQVYDRATREHGGSAEEPARNQDRRAA